MRFGAGSRAGRAGNTGEGTSGLLKSALLGTPVQETAPPAVTTGGIDTGARVVVPLRQAPGLPHIVGERVIHSPLMWTRVFQ